MRRRHRVDMTLTTLITLNAVLAAAVVYGIVRLLAAGIRSDALPRTQECDMHDATERRAENRQIAA
jgi:hypothetical protein